MKDAPVLPDRFRDAQPLGAGAQGVTFKAFDTKLGRVVAAKVLQLGRVQDWAEFERFERECNVLASIEHPGVPRYLDHYADEDEIGRATCRERGALAVVAV